MDTRDATAHQPRAAPVATILSFGLIAMTTVVTLPRLSPVGNGDFFSFVSVGERLRAGDQLYTEVWDNKDPYFYYVLSVVGGLGGWGYFVLELLWVGVAIYALSQLGRSQGMSTSWSVVVAWGIAPWCLLGTAYAGTMTVMPGIALTISIVALAARNRWAWAGALLGVLLLLKVILVPLAIAGAAVFCLDRRVRTCVTALGAAAASTAVGLSVLALRGELAPYASMLGQNSAYADRMVTSDSIDGFAQHLARAMPDGSYPGERIGAVALVLCLVAAFLRGRRDVSRLAVCAAAVSVASVVVLGLTAVWPHHAQALAAPACVSLLALCRGGPPRDARLLAAALPALVLAAYLMGGAAPVGALILGPATAAEPYRQLEGRSPEAASIATTDAVVSYSRLGRNDLSAHARGLDTLTLACPHFQQYPFDPQSTLEDTLTCLPASDVVFVARNFDDQADWPRYARFADQARAILRSRFACTPTGYGEKCLRTVDAPELIARAAVADDQ